MKKVLIYPGAFNPPHNGHIATLELALGKYSFDEVWIIPSGNREDKKIEIPFSDRKSLNTFFVNYLNERLSTRCVLRTDEFDNPENKTTSQILKELKSEPGIEFTQLAGLDSYLFLKEKIGNLILEDNFIVISNRFEYNIPEVFTFPENHKFIEGEKRDDISSTKIRNLVKNNDTSYEKLTILEIAKYIKEHKLYI